MGIRSTLKKMILPIVGGGAAKPPADARPRPPSSVAPAHEEDDDQSPRGAAPVDAYLNETVKNHKIVLFMKGSPQSPQCGFSANAAGLLRTYNRPFHHVNVLADPEVREGVKKLTAWPTIPQIFIDGEFVGGADILTELHNSGELKEMLDKAFTAQA